VQRLARTYCERAKSCGDQLEYGVPWASVEVCTDGMERILTLVDVVTSCEVSEVAVEASELSACLEQVQSVDCEIFYGQARAVASLERKFRACRAVLGALHRLRLEPRRGIIADVGQPCGPGVFCEAGSACAIAEGEVCGRCTSAPLEGEACLFLGDDGRPGCWGHGFCVEGRCRARAPVEGEPCSVLGECEEGLDCVGFESREASGRCEVVHHEGDACDGDRLLSCGEWSQCRGGTCVSALSIGKLGGPCLTIDDCHGGFCEDGTCATRRALGAACSFTAPCLEPYTCIDEVCTEPPAACAGDVGDVCTGSFQCGLGQICLQGSPSRCVMQTGREGQACVEPNYCVEGQCVDDVCVLVADGTPCAYGSECESLLCTDGECVAAACR
jgi:hypothetical protein